MTSNLTLIGAGPGDPDLLTIKAVNAIQNADCVLFDALVDLESVQKYAVDAECIFVGKRAGYAHLSQEEINQVILRKCGEYKEVVRLKGGDPLIFGRGHEEWKAAEEAGINVTYIPGVSSVTSVPGLVGLPVTKRGVASSFWVGTAVDQQRNFSRDLVWAIHANCTVVILMGIGKIPEISHRFIQAGKGDLPIAVVASGSTSRQAFWKGTVNELA
ncbi:MAG: uroporphyrinogen-III C-methyltransferase, partial [Bacteroidota bacterium]